MSHGVGCKALDVADELCSRVLVKDAAGEKGRPLPALGFARVGGKPLDVAEDDAFSA